MITIYGSANSRSIRVTWMMEELGKDYQFSNIDFSKGESQSAKFLAINPAGKVPALSDNDLLLTESAAIVSYLGDKFQRTDLVPAAGTTDRGRYDQWCYFAMTELEQPLWTLGKHRFAIPAKYRVADIIPTAEWEFQQALKLFSLGLAENDYILGQQFSAADILLTQTLMWAAAFNQKIEQPNLRHYFEKIQQRPSLLSAQQREKHGSQ
jgi:glutathione S-transferase